MEQHPVYDLSNEVVEELARTFPDVATELGISGYDDGWTDLTIGGEGRTGLLLNRRRGAFERAAPTRHREMGAAGGPGSATGRLRAGTLAPGPPRGVQERAPTGRGATSTPR